MHAHIWMSICIQQSLHSFVIQKLILNTYRWLNINRTQLHFEWFNGCQLIESFIEMQQTYPSDFIFSSTYLPYTYLMIFLSRSFNFSMCIHVYIYVYTYICTCVFKSSYICTYILTLCNKNFDSYS